MNLWIKAVILLVVFIGLESAQENKDLAECGLQYARFLSVNACNIYGNQSNQSTVRKMNGFPFIEMEWIRSRGADQTHDCCTTYSAKCMISGIVKKYCKNTKDLHKDEIKHKEELRKTCNPFPTKEVCAKYKRKVPARCHEYTFYECDSFTWGSSEAMSSNGWFPFLSLMPSIYFVLKSH